MTTQDKLLFLIAKILLYILCEITTQGIITADDIQKLNDRVKSFEWNK